MDLPGGGNPMAEIALALSMAFFSVLVLALVSMRAGAAPEAMAEGLDMRPPAAAGEAAARPETLLIHWRGRLYDAALRPVEPSGLGAGPLVVAVDPGLPVAEAVALRRRFADRELTVTALDGRWLARLKESMR